MLPKQMHALDQKATALRDGRQKYAILDDDDPEDPLGPAWSVEEVSVSRDALDVLLKFVALDYPDIREMPSTQRIAHQTLAAEAGLSRHIAEEDEP